MHRLFVGLRPPAAIRARLLALMGGVHGARWQEDDQLHVTLRFIGEVERPRAEDAAAALGQVHFPAFEATLDGVGAFDDRRGRLNAIWAGLRPHDALAQLHRKVDQALLRVGVPPDRRAYLPHVTLARLSAPVDAARGFLETHAGLASPPFAFERFHLFESHLGRGSARYEMIESYRLGD